MKAKHHVSIVTLNQKYQMNIVAEVMKSDLCFIFVETMLNPAAKKQPSDVQYSYMYI